nr:hypothetical protein [Tanacetum cinerariifolium]
MVLIKVSGLDEVQLVRSLNGIHQWSLVIDYLHTVLGIPTNTLHNQNTSGTTAFSAPGASSTHDMMSLNSNNKGISSIIPFDDGKMGNQDGRLSSVANLDNRNQSNPLVYVVYQQLKLESHMPDHAQHSAFGVPGASSTHSMIYSTSNNDDLSSILFGLDDKNGNQGGQSSFMAIADNRNQSKPLAIVGNQQQQITSYMQNNTSSQTTDNVLGGSSTQGTLTRSTFVQAPWNKSPSPVNITVKEELGEFSSGSMVMPIKIITIEDNEPVQRRSSSRPPKLRESSSGAA